MKSKKAATPFVDQLKKALKSLKKMKPGEIHVLSINANYGHYQITIGPAMKGKSAKRPGGMSIEINGEIHHLFVDPKGMKPQPSKKQMRENLKNTVIMRNLSIHLKDPKGDGKHLVIEKNEQHALHPRESINLAGDYGEKVLNEVEHGKKYQMAAYQIVQQDILNALSNEEETVESG